MTMQFNIHLQFLGRRWYPGVTHSVSLPRGWHPFPHFHIMLVSSSENGDSTYFKGYVLVHSDCITEHPRLGGLYNKYLFLTVLKSKIKVLADQVPRMAERKIISLVFLLMRLLVPFMRPYSHDLIASQRPHFQLLSYWGLSFQHTIFFFCRGDRNIQSITVFMNFNKLPIICRLPGTLWMLFIVE